MKPAKKTPFEPRSLCALLPLLVAAALLCFAVDVMRPASLGPLEQSTESSLHGSEPLPPHRAPLDQRAALDAVEVLGELDLEALLLSAHTAFSTRDAARLSSSLEQLLVDPERALGILDGLRGERWGAGAGALTPLEDGARLAVGAGAALYTSAASPAEPAFGERFLEGALSSIPRMRARLSRSIAAELARAEVEGVRVLGAEWLPLLLRLRWDHPEVRPAFDLLLEAVCADEEADTAVIARLLLSDEEDLGLLRLALARLLRDDPDHWLGFATECFERATDLATRAALASAIATAAPPADAARFLASAADPQLCAQAATLASREGGLMALAEQYEERLISGSDPAARRALVVGLARDADLCLGIARTDPDRGVRGQALLSATVRSASHEALDVVRAAWQSGDDRHYGVAPRHLVWAAANAASRADASLRPAAVDLLRSLAADARLGRVARLDACARLDRWLSPAEHAALVAELSALPIMDSNDEDLSPKEPL